MAKPTEVERAFERCSALSAIVQHVRDDALARPNEAVWLKLGLVEQGDTKRDALARLEKLFDEVQSLIEHVFVLDMAAQFERTSLERVKNYIGSARSASAGPMKKAGLPSLALRVIKETAEFEGMTAYLSLLEGHVDKDLMEVLKAVRSARNLFAHGLDVRVPPTVEREVVRDGLTEALAAM